MNFELPSEGTPIENTIEFVELYRFWIFGIGVIIGLGHTMAFYIPAIGFMNMIVFTVISVMMILLGVFGIGRYIA